MVNQKHQKHKEHTMNQNPVAVETGWAHLDRTVRALYDGGDGSTARCAVRASSEGLGCQTSASCGSHA